MTKFRVPVCVQFNAVVWVDAEDAAQAEEIATFRTRARFEGGLASTDRRILDSVVDTRGDVYRRDNEMIEEED